MAYTTVYTNVRVKYIFLHEHYTSYAVRMQQKQKWKPCLSCSPEKIIIVILILLNIRK